MTIRVCAWHDKRQQTLWAATHGVCPICRERALLDLMPIGDRSAKWPQAMKDGGWDFCQFGDWQQGLYRILADGDREDVRFDEDSRQWVRWRNGEDVKSSNNLSEVL